jgi:hypothetical protein
MPGVHKLRIGSVRKYQNTRSPKVTNRYGSKILEYQEFRSYELVPFKYISIPVFPKLRTGTIPNIRMPGGPNV